jgi:hypothetical protein
MARTASSWARTRHPHRYCCAHRCRALAGCGRPGRDRRGAAAPGADGQWDGVPGFWTTIGDATVKYHAWGDGYDRSRLVDHGDGFTVWYGRDGATVGVLTLNADDDYERGETLIKNGQPVCLPG